MFPAFIWSFFSSHSIIITFWENWKLILICFFTGRKSYNYKPYSSSNSSSSSQQNSSTGKSSRSRRSRDELRAGPYSTFEPPASAAGPSSGSSSSSRPGSKRHHRSSTTAATTATASSSGTTSSPLTPTSASVMGGSVSSKFIQTWQWLATFFPTLCRLTTPCSVMIQNP